MSQKNIIFKGKKITYSTEGQLKTKLKLTGEQTSQLLKDYSTGKTRRYYANKKGDTGFYDLKDKPLFIQKFGRKKITNKEFIGEKKSSTRSTFSTFKKYPKSQKVKLTIKIFASLRFSPPNYEKRDFDVEINERTENLTNAFFKDLVRDFYVPLDDDDIIIDNVEAISEFSNQNIPITAMALGQRNPLNIGQIFNEVIPNKDGNCVFDYMNKIYPRASKKKISKLKTTEDLYNYAVENNIKMVAYDINGNVIKSYYPETKSKKKNLIYVAFNNHLYPLKNQVLNKVKKPVNYETHFLYAPQNINNDIIDPLEEKLIQFLEEGILPNWIGFFSKKVSSFFVDDINYVYNTDYPVCEMVLSRLGLKDYLKPSTKIRQLGDIIEKLYLKKNINSFMPNSHQFKRGGFNYQNDFEIDDVGNFIGLDKNLHYPYALSKLPYLIKCNYMTAKRKTKNIEKIIPHYLYNIVLEESNILTMNNNIYSGEQLIYYQKQGINFIIKEEIETEKTENYFKTMIEDLFEKFDKHIVKEIMVCVIGKMERNRQLYSKSKFKKICSKEEADTFSGYKREIKIQNKKWWVKDSDKLYICSTEEPAFELKCRMPIAIQIKDYSRVIIYEMCKELGLKQSDILGVKTDCIYIHKRYYKHFEKYLGKGLGDWKTQEYNDAGLNSKNKLVIEKKINVKPENKFYNYLSNAYAGGGKTYTIIHNVIPKMPSDDYIVLSPSWSSLTEYLLGGYNCDVIHTYTIQNRLPKEKYIIIDEVGMLDKTMMELLLKCSLVHKTIIAFGDFKQLLPVKDNGENSSNLWLNYMFSVIDTEWVNYRNGFSKEYYDSLIYGKKDYVKEQVKKHSTKKFWNAEVIIAHTNATRNIYNKMMCEREGIKNLYDVGAKIMCKTNDLKKLRIYNNYNFVVREYVQGDRRSKDKVTLEHEMIGQVNIDREDIEKYFEYSYARTIYNLQGSTIGSYYFAEEDLDWIDGRMGYTIISRLKGQATRRTNKQVALNKYLKHAEWDKKERFYKSVEKN